MTVPVSVGPGRNLKLLVFTRTGSNYNCSPRTCHYENMPMQNTAIFKIVKKKLKIFYFFLIFAQNIDCGYTLEPPRRGGSNKYPQSMFWSKNKKNRYTPCIPQFFYIKVGFKGVDASRTCFPDVV